MFSEELNLHTKNTSMKNSSVATSLVSELNFPYTILTGQIQIMLTRVAEYKVLKYGEGTVIFIHLSLELQVKVLLADK